MKLYLPAVHCGVSCKTALCCGCKQRNRMGEVQGTKLMYWFNFEVYIPNWTKAGIKEQMDERECSKNRNMSKTLQGVYIPYNPFLQFHGVGCDLWGKFCMLTWMGQQTMNVHVLLNVEIKFATQQSNLLKRISYKDWDWIIQLLKLLLAKTFIDRICSLQLHAITYTQIWSWLKASYSAAIMLHLQTFKIYITMNTNVSIIHCPELAHPNLVPSFCQYQVPNLKSLLSAG